MRGGGGVGIWRELCFVSKKRNEKVLCCTLVQCIHTQPHLIVAVVECGRVWSSACTNDRMLSSCCAPILTISGLIFYDVCSCTCVCVCVCMCVCVCLGARLEKHKGAEAQVRIASIF